MSLPSQWLWLRIVRLEAETAYLQEVTALQHDMWRSMQRRSALQRKAREAEARAAQAWEDWVMNDAMTTPASPSRTRKDQAVQTEEPRPRDGEPDDGMAKRQRTIVAPPPNAQWNEYGGSGSVGGTNAAEMSAASTGRPEQPMLQRVDCDVCRDPAHGSGDLDGGDVTVTVGGIGGGSPTVESDNVDAVEGPEGGCTCDGMEGIEATVPDVEDAMGNM